MICSGYTDGKLKEDLGLKVLLLSLWKELSTPLHPFSVPSPVVYLPDECLLCEAKAHSVLNDHL
jgi:hypothetical protein